MIHSSKQSYLIGYRDAISGQPDPAYDHTHDTAAYLSGWAAGVDDLNDAIFRASLLER